MLGDIVERGDVTGEDAFFLHDTLGFPIDLTREIAGERERTVDLDDFDRLMGEQRRRARAAADEAGAAAGDNTGVARAARRVRCHGVHGAARSTSRRRAWSRS